MADEIPPGGPPTIDELDAKIKEAAADAEATEKQASATSNYKEEILKLTKAIADQVDAEITLRRVKGESISAMERTASILAQQSKTYADLMDLGMNIEARYAGRIFEVAGTNLKTALDAKAAKVDKKLKMVELQLKKSKLDRDSGELDAVESTGTIVDRNELLKNLIKK